MTLVGTSPSYFSMRVRAIALIWSSAVDASVTETSLQVAHAPRTSHRPHGERRVHNGTRSHRSVMRLCYGPMLADAGRRNSALHPPVDEGLEGRLTDRLVRRLIPVRKRSAPK